MAATSRSEPDFTSSPPSATRQSSTKETEEHSDIICYEHCGHRIFALASSSSNSSSTTTTNSICPSCRLRLSECSFEAPPFAVPSPFHRASDRPMCIVIRPTKIRGGGGFLSPAYDPGGGGGGGGGRDLHVGVTDSAGNVHEFSRRGARVVGAGSREERKKWGACVVVDVARGSKVASDPYFPEYWDSRLSALASRPPWSEGTAAYDETSLNCLDFVLSFLSSVPEAGEAAAQAKDKVEFCRRFVLPATRTAARYICLRRKLLDLQGEEGGGGGTVSGALESSADKTVI